MNSLKGKKEKDIEKHKKKNEKKMEKISCLRITKRKRNKITNNK